MTFEGIWRIPGVPVHHRTERRKSMSWVQYGEVWEDDGQHGDEQVGKAASVRFMNEDLPGHLTTVYAFPIGVSCLGEDGDNVEVTGINTITEKMVCRDIDDPGSTEIWCDYEYGELDVRPLKGVEDAEKVALFWIKAFDAERDIHWEWDGN